MPCLSSALMVDIRSVFSRWCDGDSKNLIFRDRMKPTGIDELFSKESKGTLYAFTFTTPRFFRLIGLCRNNPTTVRIRFAAVSHHSPSE
jgi:hypothetical protein